MLADGDRWWVVKEQTFDSRREIGSMSALRTEWEKRCDFDPMVEIARLGDQNTELLTRIDDAIEALRPLAQEVNVLPVLRALRVIEEESHG